jgi:hypothetical protein
MALEVGDLVKGKADLAQPPSGRNGGKGRGLLVSGNPLRSAKTEQDTAQAWLWL